MDASVFLSEEAKVIHAAKGAPRRGRFRGKTAGRTTVNSGIRPVTTVIKRPVTSMRRPPLKTMGKRPVTSVIRTAKQDKPRAKPKSVVVKTTVRKLLPKPKKSPAKVCPKKHPLKIFTGDVDGYSCNLCSKMCDQVYGCRICDWDACGKCLKMKTGKNPAPGKNKDDPICWDFVKGKCKRNPCKWKHDQGPDWGPPSRPPQSGQSFQRGGRYGMRSMPQNLPSSGSYNPYRNALASSRNGNYSRNGSLFNGFRGGSSFNSRAGEEFIEKDLSWQHQDMKPHYAVNTRDKREPQWDRPRNGNSKEQNWGKWEKRGTSFGSKMLNKWGVGDKFSKTKSGTNNRANFGLFSSGGRKRKRMQNDPYSNQIPMNGNRGNKRWKKTHVDRSKGKISQLPLNKRGSGASKKGKGGGTSKSTNAGAGKKKRPGKGEKGYELCWSFSQGKCKHGSKCKWKHS